MNVGSLFSGIGGIDLGLERAGMRVVWQCESDPYARAVLRKHWPSVPCYEDVSRLRGSAVAPVDLLAGGFPCQDISAAGLGAGLGGERSGLWFHFARIIGETRPQYAIIESTPPFRRWVPVVRRHLRSAGYASLPIQLRAADFGAPHIRKRLFVLAHAPCDRRQPWWTGHTEEIKGGRQSGRGGFGKHVANPDGEGLAFAGQRGGHSEAARGVVAGPAADGSGQGADVPNTTGERADDGRRVELAERGEGARRLCVWDVEPDVGRVADGVRSRVDRLRCLGNAVVPQVAEWIGRLILSHARAERP